MSYIGGFVGIGIACAIILVFGDSLPAGAGMVIGGAGGLFGWAIGTAFEERA